MLKARTPRRGRMTVDAKFAQARTLIAELFAHAKAQEEEAVHLETLRRIASYRAGKEKTMTLEQFRNKTRKLLSKK